MLKQKQLKFSPEEGNISYVRFIHTSVGHDQTEVAFLSHKYYYFICFLDESQCHLIHWKPKTAQVFAMRDKGDRAEI